MMKTKNYILSILVFYTLFQPLALHAVTVSTGSSPKPVYYMIHLKNGDLFVTHRYWTQGNQIVFSIYGGQMGVDKKNIEKIVEMTDKVDAQLNSENSR